MGAIAVIAVALSACVPPPPPPPPLPDPPSGVAADPVALAVGPPSINTLDFPDPSILKTGNSYFAYSTGSGPSTLQMLTSTDLVNWSFVGDAFVGPGVWATQDGSPWAELEGTTWAPFVLERPANPPDARFVLYYASRSVVPSSAGMQCIGRAVSATPTGPFFDQYTSPLLCQADRGGSIDPTAIVAHDQVYLISQSFGIAATGEPTRIWTTPLTADGLNAAGTSTQILVSMPDTFESPVIESPAMMPAPGGGYLLFYSAGRWWEANYAVATAWCETPTTPCIRVYSHPLLTTRGAMAGPGGEDVFQDASGNWWMVFHAWTAPFVGYQLFDDRHARMLRLLPITFPQVNHPKIG